MGVTRAIFRVLVRKEEVARRRWPELRTSKSPPSIDVPLGPSNDGHSKYSLRMAGACSIPIAEYFELTPGRRPLWPWWAARCPALPELSLTWLVGPAGHIDSDLTTEQFHSPNCVDHMFYFIHVLFLRPSMCEFFPPASMVSLWEHFTPHPQI